MLIGTQQLQHIQSSPPKMEFREIRVYTDLISTSEKLFPILIGTHIIKELATPKHYSDWIELL